METKSSDRKKAASGFSLGLIAIVLAIVIVVNLLVCLLPENLTQLDISSSKLYSVTSSTKAVVSNLEDEITIYWITQSGEEDDVIEKLLAKYDALSSKITVTKKDPDVYPTFATQYTSDTVSNNDLIVECGDRYRYITYSDIYEYDNVDYYTGSYDYYFDGEGEITSAINYVTTDDLPKLYVLAGHGEAELPTTFSSAIQKQNIETESLTLPDIDELPEDADALLIYTPASDISEVELEMLQSYIADGGKILCFCGPQADGNFENLSALLSGYGVTPAEGIVIETDRSYYAFQQPYTLLPVMNEDETTDSISADSGYIIVPIAQGLSVEETSGITVTSLLDTSENAIVKADGYNLTSYELEDQDTQGQFSLAVRIEKEYTNAEDGEKGQLIWISSSYLLDATYNSYSAGSNTEFATNCIHSLIGDTVQSISIPTKSIGYEYLTISESEAGFLKTIMIIAVPMVFVVFGVVEVIQRKKLR